MKPVLEALTANFLGNSPIWYKQFIALCLIANPILYFVLGMMGLPAGFIIGWLMLLQFIFTLAMALQCYPLQPGGLLALEAALMGLVSPEAIYHEVQVNLSVILLLTFMVAGVYYLRNLLLFSFTTLLLKVRHTGLLSLIFLLVSAVMSAFLDALTVTAVLISVCSGFYYVHQKAIAKLSPDVAATGNIVADADMDPQSLADVEDFRKFLRSLLMHSLIGTALGGVCTIVGEPQNILIAEKAGWKFMDFLLFMAPVTIPTMLAGIVTMLVLNQTRWFGYGASLPDRVRNVLQEFDLEMRQTRTKKDTAVLFAQTFGVILLAFALILHIAEVGLLGLALIVLMTALNGIIEEHDQGQAFHEALPFVALLVVFFAIVAVIHEQHLFQPVTDYVLAASSDLRPILLYTANGLLSAISDNVFVASVYIGQVEKAFQQGVLTQDEFHMLAATINIGTNIPSVATPNGQAAFLFMLTSSLAPLIRLSYLRMLYMALPYTVVLSLVALVALYYYPSP